MKQNLQFLLLSIFLFVSKASVAQSFKAYYQQNYRWNGSAFIESNQALTSTKFLFNGNKVQIDNERLTITNRISNSEGDFITAISADGSNIRVSISMTTKKDASGKVFNCITLERAKVYKIIYYLE